MQTPPAEYNCFSSSLCMDTMLYRKLLPRYSGQGNPQPHVGVSTCFLLSLPVSPSLSPTVLFLVRVVWFWAGRDGNRAGFQTLSPAMWLHTILAAYTTLRLYTTTCLKNARAHAEGFSWLSLIKMHEVRGRVTLFASFPVIRHNQGTITASSSCWGEDERDAYFNTIFY